MTLKGENVISKQYSQEAGFLRHGQKKSVRKGSTGRAALLCLGLALLIALVCSGVAEAAGPSTWSKTFGGGKTDMGHAVARTSDGYVVAGETWSYVNSSSSSRDFYLIKTDLSGNQVWYRHIGGDRDDKAAAVFVDGDGYVVTGMMGTPHQWGVGLVKYYANGTLAWNRTFTGAAIYEGTAVTRVGNYYLVCGFKIDDDRNRTAYVLKTDLNGNRIWSKTYGDGSSYIIANDIIGVPGGYLVVGQKEGQVYLLKLDESGMIVSEKLLGDSSYYPSGNSIVAAGNKYYIVGDANRPDNGDGVYVAKVDVGLNEVWHRAYFGDASDYIRGTSLDLTAAGLVIAGTYIDEAWAANETRYPYLARLTLDGDLVRNTTLKRTGSHEVESITAASDGDYVIAGTVEASDDKDVYLAKVSSSVLDPTPTPRPATPTPTPGPSGVATSAPTAGGSPTVAPAEETGETVEPTDVATAQPAASPTETLAVEPGASATPAPVESGPTATPAASAVPTQSPSGSSDGFTTGNVIIIALLAVVATLLVVGIGMGLFFLLTRK